MGFYIRINQLERHDETETQRLSTKKENKMDKLAEKMAELAERFGPTVVDAARGAVRVEAYSSMMASAVALAASVALVMFGRFLWAKRDQSDDFDGYAVTACIAWGISVCLLFPGLWGFIDPWVWTALNNPDLYLAKKIFKL